LSRNLKIDLGNFETFADCIFNWIEVFFPEPGFNIINTFQILSFAANTSDYDLETVAWNYWNKPTLSFCTIMHNHTY